MHSQEPFVCKLSCGDVPSLVWNIKEFVFKMYMVLTFPYRVLIRDHALFFRDSIGFCLNFSLHLLSAGKWVNLEPWCTDKVAPL